MHNPHKFFFSDKGLYVITFSFQMEKAQFNQLILYKMNYCIFACLSVTV